MLSVAEALTLVERHLGTAPRAVHSRAVARVLRGLAVHLSEDAELWEVVGLTHDLDYLATADDRSRHGLLTAEWLGDRLPQAARDAIAAHDHRTGVQADTRLADMLKLADALVVIEERLGREVWSNPGEAELFATLRGRLGQRGYLADIVQTQATTHDLQFALLAEIMRDLPATS